MHRRRTVKITINTTKKVLFRSKTKKVKVTALSKGKNNAKKLKFTKEENKKKEEKLVRFKRKKEKSRIRFLNRKERKKHQSLIPKSVKILDTESLYYPYKPWMDDFKKYWRTGENTSFQICDSPWAIFVEDYIQIGDKILNNLKDHDVFRWGWEAYEKHKINIDNIKSKKMGKSKYSSKSANRMIRITNSIKKYGYCEGEYKSDEYLINVVKNYKAPNGEIGYKLLWGNRRSAVCCGIGMKEVKVRCWEHY